MIYESHCVAINGVESQELRISLTSLWLTAVLASNAFNLSKPPGLAFEPNEPVLAFVDAYVLHVLGAPSLSLPSDGDL